MQEGWRVLGLVIAGWWWLEVVRGAEGVVIYPGVDRWG